MLTKAWGVKDNKKQAHAEGAFTTHRFGAAPTRSGAFGWSAQAGVSAAIQTQRGPSQELFDSGFVTLV